MKKVKFTEAQIVKALKEHESGRNAEDISRELGINRATFYNWKKKYGGMETQELKRLKELEEENRKLKAMYADLALESQDLKGCTNKKVLKPCERRDGVEYISANVGLPLIFDVFTQSAPVVSFDQQADFLFHLLKKLDKKENSSSPVR